MGQIVCVGGGRAALNGIYFSGAMVVERTRARAQKSELTFSVPFAENAIWACSPQPAMHRRRLVFIRARSGECKGSTCRLAVRETNANQCGALSGHIYPRLHVKSTEVF